MNIKEGEVFAIKTKKGYGFLQFIATNNLGVEIIRVLEPIKRENEISQQEVNVQERFTVQFVVKAALRKKIVERSGVFTIPKSFQLPVKARSEHNVKGEFLGWHIIDQKTLQRELKKSLSPQDLRLSPHGIPNDTLLIENLENNWRLENWK